LGFKASIKVDKLYHIFTMQRTKDSINNYINIIYLVNNAFTEKRRILPLFLYKQLVTKRLCGNLFFFRWQNFVEKTTKFGKYFEIYVFLLYISLLFLKFGKKKSKFLKSQIYQKMGEKKNPLWWRPRGQTLGKGSMILFHGFNSQVKDQNPKQCDMWLATCALDYAWSENYWVFFHLHSNFPLKRTNNVDTAKEYSHKNPMYLNLCCEWTYYFRYSTM
jgi:hypothetical protein